MFEGWGGWVRRSVRLVIALMPALAGLLGGAPGHRQRDHRRRAGRPDGHRRHRIGRAGRAAADRADLWPVRPDTDLLARTVKAMRAVKKFTLHEQVASDTAGMTSLELSGNHFVDSEPYATDKATQTSRFTDIEGHTVLVLGYPGERLALKLTLDDHDRVVRETLVAPNHFIHRSFTYPEVGGVG
nr:hypothetical protein [Streptomyces sp. S1D4-11]QIZ00734.1 hypothetical protein HEP87_52175 [Streptomyces sp. S1D4-11]